jgi:hypothetical protein
VQLPKKLRGELPGQTPTLRLSLRPCPVRAAVWAQTLACHEEQAHQETMTLPSVKAANLARSVGCRLHSAYAQGTGMADFWMLAVAGARVVGNLGSLPRPVFHLKFFWRSDSTSSCLPPLFLASCGC